ncbi:hypothetical protein CFBP8129_04980 [Xanthomonas hortorum pv. gardneri]|uniref:Teneurin-like YD-shell domain-containing protein n=9 Tax=Xanthomonas hortorum TaxID=56454 RepID=A0A6V7BP21_9XANT|nr:hypothetical protein CFBP8129_04980 [Xanthomonas hortorum pv. gardneri]CAD0303782.1 hypothetical protein CFBP8129_04980 [Xanthomonas hortorum pv. gardneri]
MDRVKTYTDRRKRVTTYGYDTLGRPTTTTLPSMGGTLTASYDAGNRMVALADSLSGTLGWDYDNFDQLAAANSPQGTITYGYDAAGRRTRMQAATQAEVVYAHDNADRLKDITQGAEKVIFAYDNANRLTTQTLPNQVQTVYTYNNADQVTGMAWGKAGQAALGSLGYGYNTVGQLVAQTGTHAPQALPTATSGNSFDDNNRQTAANNVALSYDESGNLLSDGSRTYVWDDRDRLSQIQQGGTTIASFSYDALGRRTAKTEGGTSTQYLYDRLDTVQETQGTTVNPILTGLGIDQRYARNDTSGRTYFLTDQLGSTRLLTNAAGSAVQRYDYDPYGTTTQSSAAYTNPYQYTGREKDASGLYYYRARYYRPQWGRFISEDPIQLFAGPNSYAYVGANPIGLIDPLGLWSLTLTGYIPTEILGPIGPGGGVVLTGIGLSINSISFRGGIGAGAGISFNPFGTPPDSNHMDAPCGNKSGIGVYVDGSAGVGIFGAGTGWNYGGTQSVGPDGRPRWQEYGGFSSAPTLDATIGSGAQVGAGIEVTKYF